MYGQDTLWGISKGNFESYPWFDTKLKSQVLLDFSSYAFSKWSSVDILERGQAILSYIQISCFWWSLYTSVLPSIFANHRKQWASLVAVRRLTVLVWQMIGCDWWKGIYLGPVLIKRPSFPGMGIPMLKIRWSWDHLLFNMGIPILVSLYWDGPQVSLPYSQECRAFMISCYQPKKAIKPASWLIKSDAKL